MIPLKNASLILTSIRLFLMLLLLLFALAAVVVVVVVVVAVAVVAAVVVVIVVPWKERVWAGLRPGRSEVRLETEFVEPTKPTEPTGQNNQPPASASTDTTQVPTISATSSVPVIHCYGHGGCGITLAMGCADDLVCNHLLPLLNE